MAKKIPRKIYYFKNYYLDFFKKLDPGVRKKFNWTLELISVLEWIPEKYFKCLHGASGLYEIRVEVGSDIFRVFCFFDAGNLIVLINGFQKKTQKTPAQEIELAKKLKSNYYYEKNK